MGNDDAAAGSANNNGDMFTFFGHEYDLSQEEFSTSSYYCTITNEYPYNPVHFGGDTRHVFERSAIFRYIATMGVISARRNVKHPLNDQMYPRSRGEDLISNVLDAERVALISELRRRSGENPDEPTDPLTDEDRSRMDEMLRFVTSG